MSKKLKLEDIVIQSFVTSRLSATEGPTTITQNGRVTITEPGPAEMPTVDEHTHVKVNTLYYTQLWAGCFDVPPQCETNANQVCESCWYSRQHMQSGVFQCPNYFTNKSPCPPSANGEYCTDNTHQDTCARGGTGGNHGDTHVPGVACASQINSKDPSCLANTMDFAGNCKTLNWASSECHFATGKRSNPWSVCDHFTDSGVQCDTFPMEGKQGCGLGGGV